MPRDPAVNDRTQNATPGETASPANAMTVDVEDYFQVSAMEPVISRESWGSFECRVERNVDRILEQFDRQGAVATFFTLSWIARRYPEMIRRIVAEGHEIASHGTAHWRVSGQTPEEFRSDVREAKAALEDISGHRVRGYRAASFSFTQETPWAHEILGEEGHAYSSSVYPVRHDHYGIPDAPRHAYRPLAGSDFLEIPISTLQLGARRVPCGGGGFFRLYPFMLTRWAMQHVNSHDKMPGVFYFHPWEIDPDQPRIAGLSRRTRFRHYLNLARTESRLERLLAAFRWSRMDRVFLPGGEG